MKFVSIDIETTGLDEKTCQLIEFAGVIADTRDNTPVNKLPRFQRIIKHPRLSWEEKALELHQDWYFKALTDCGSYVTSPETLLHQFGNWLAVNGISPTEVIPAGKNFASFDMRFISLLNGYGSTVSFHRRTLDPMMLFLNPVQDEIPPDTKECLKRANLISIDLKGHRAVDDAMLVILLLRSGWKLPDNQPSLNK